MAEPINIRAAIELEKIINSDAIAKGFGGAMKSELIKVFNDPSLLQSFITKLRVGIKKGNLDIGQGEFAQDVASATAKGEAKRQLDERTRQYAEAQRQRAQISKAYAEKELREKQEYHKALFQAEKEYLDAIERGDKEQDKIDRERSKRIADFKIKQAKELAQKEIEIEKQKQQQIEAAYASRNSRAPGQISAAFAARRAGQSSIDAKSRAAANAAYEARIAAGQPGALTDPALAGEIADGALGLDKGVANAYRRYNEKREKIRRALEKAADRAEKEADKYEKKFNSYKAGLESDRLAGENAAQRYFRKYEKFKLGQAVDPNKGFAPGDPISIINNPDLRSVNAARAAAIQAEAERRAKINRQQQDQLNSLLNQSIKQIQVNSQPLGGATTISGILNNPNIAGVNAARAAAQAAEAERRAKINAQQLKQFNALTGGGGGGGGGGQGNTGGIPADFGGAAVLAAKRYLAFVIGTKIFFEIGAQVRQATQEVIKLEAQLTKIEQVTGAGPSKRVAAQLEKLGRLKAKVRGAMVYPVATMVIAVVVTIFLLIKVIPEVAKLYSSSNAQLPVLTVFVLGISGWVQKNILTMLGALAGVFIGFKVLYKRPEFREIYDPFVLKLPLFGALIKKSSIARFTRTLGTLVSSGVPLLTAFDICIKLAENVVIKSILQNAVQSITEGKSIVFGLQYKNIFPPMVLHMVNIGEMTGRLDELLGKVSDIYDDEVDDTINIITGLLQPMMIVFVGMIIAFLLLAMYMPIFQLAEKVMGN
jgi:hypothetical protein